MEDLSENDLSENIFQPTSKKSPPRKSIKITDVKTLKTRNINSFSCKFCEAQFKTKSNCTRHEVYRCSANPNIEPPKFSCSHCNASFNQKHNCTLHEVTCRANSNERATKFLCPYCSALFSAEKNCKRHEKYVCCANPNKDSPRFSCPHCKGQFSSKWDCTKHERTCSVNPNKISPKFLCSYCSALFISEKNCLRHETYSCNANPNKASPRFPCPHCNRGFQINSQCTKHKTMCLFNPNRSSHRFACAHCNTSFNFKHSLSHHLKTCSAETPNSQKFNRSKTPCLVKNCGEQFYTRNCLIAHMSAVHQDVITIHPKVSKTFSSIEEFYVWKENEEESTFSYFTLRKGQVSHGIKYYYCQQDGSKKPHSKQTSSTSTSTRIRNKGRVKVGNICVAKMKVTVNKNKSVLVDYFPTHSHICKKEDMVHHPLPASMSKFINEKLAEGVAPIVVYDLVKDRFVHSARAATFNKKIVFERARKLRLRCRLDVDDSKAVFLLTHKLMEKDNSVLIYKPYGEELVHGPEGIDGLPCSTDLFMFAFQTDRQLDLMKKHGSKILIVGETPDTNLYRYQLVNVMVIDENGRGRPVAHLITSRSDADTLQFFFQTLNSRLNNEVSINCVITNDDSKLIDAMTAGFHQELWHILCKWNVFKNLKENLKSKVPQELFDEILSEIKVIVDTQNENVFKRLKEDFRIKYSSNPGVRKYVSYLEQNYWPIVGKWAMCYRNFPHGEVNTIGLLESFHNRLRIHYLKRKKEKRLDDLINTLYSIERDDEATIGFAVQPQDILERHNRGLLMDDSMIIEQTLDRLWEVKSTINKSTKTYFVERNNDSCNVDMCFSNCTEAECHSLCSHLFSCSCPDHHPLCEHIHKIQSYLTKNEPFVPDEDNCYVFEIELSDEIPDTEEAEGTCGISLNPNRNIFEQMRSNMSIVQQFIDTAEENDANENTVMYVNTVLSDLVRVLEPLKKEMILPQ